MSVMRYRQLGTSDLRVSVVGIGCWAMGGAVETWGPVDENEAIAAIHEGLGLGITFIDTAPAYGYGHSEEIVGRALVGRRDDVVIGTKCGLVWRERGGKLERNLRPDSIRRECEASLRRLRVETIDLYQIHYPDPATPINRTMEALLALQEEGKIRAIGVSNFSCEQISQARKLGPIVSLQPEFSLLDREAAEELLPYCREYGIGVVTYGSLARGLLTGKFSPDSRFADMRATDPRFIGPAFRRNLELVERLREYAAALHCSVAQLALGWVIHQEGVTCAIAGVKRPSQVRENAGAGDLVIPPDVLDRVDSLLKEQA
jgi:aryl-alcohol dehydrogenase-like predicted oxidoreductase